MFALTVASVLFYSLFAITCGALMTITSFVNLHQRRSGKIDFITAHQRLRRALFIYGVCCISGFLGVLIATFFFPQYLIQWSDVVYSWLLSWGTLR